MTYGLAKLVQHGLENKRNAIEMGKKTVVFAVG
jgi:hypothetical protein